MTKLLHRIEDLLDKASEKSVAAEESLVRDGHDHERRLWLATVIRFVVGMTAMLGYMWTPEPWNGLFGAVLGWVVGTACMASSGRAFAYRRGWLDGRERFIKQMQAHAARGSSAEDWLRTEGDHDMVHVLGLPPLPGRYHGPPIEWDT